MVDKYGTIIEGTLRPCDIAEACLDWLIVNAPEVYRELANQFKDEYGWSLPATEDDFWNTDEWFLFETVYPLMHEQAPDGYYFGAHPGDGSDIGFHLEAYKEVV